MQMIFDLFTIKGNRYNYFSIVNLDDYSFYVCDGRQKKKSDELRGILK